MACRHSSRERNQRQLSTTARHHTASSAKAHAVVQSSSPLSSSPPLSSPKLTKPEERRRSHLEGNPLQPYSLVSDTCGDTPRVIVRASSIGSCNSLVLLSRFTAAHTCGRHTGHTLLHTATHCVSLTSPPCLPRSRARERVLLCARPRATSGLVGPAYPLSRASVRKLKL